MNTLVADRDKAAAALVHLAVTSTPWSPLGLRLTPGPDAKSPAIQSEPAFLKGMIEVQDEGSQVATLLAGAAPGEQVVDLCAGAGGKTLALAAMMENHGQIYATDLDKRRLAPIHARLERAAARDVQVRTPRGGRGAPDPLADLHGRIDLVVIDAPCTGTGTWRRNPDAKWRIRPGALTQRLAEQVEVLDRAARAGQAGGRIGYITCSVLAEEGPDQVAAFLTRHAGFPCPSRRPSTGHWEPPPRIFSDRGPLARPRSAHDAAAHRHGRIFCEHPARPPDSGEIPPLAASRQCGNIKH